MNYSNQIPFPEAEFAENPDPRCPCILLLDTSASMMGEPIAQLKDGIEQFWDELNGDQIAKKRVELSIITFGPVRVHTDFVTPDGHINTDFKASGLTPIAEAVERALDILNKRKQIYMENGIQYYRPWIFLLTDGGPTDHWQSVVKKIREGEAQRKFMFFGIGVKNADFEILRQLCPEERPPLLLDGLRFKDFFLWLSASLKIVSASSTDEQVALPPPGWGTTT